MKIMRNASLAKEKKRGEGSGECVSKAAMLNHKIIISER